MTERHHPDHDSHLEEVAEWHPIEGTPTKKKVAVGCSIGATIETYDFIGFGTAAALYFNDAFFPADDPLSGTLLSFATLGIGFAVRPLGGIIGGYLGDRIGRQAVLVGALRGAQEGGCAGDREPKKSRSSSGPCCSWASPPCSSACCRRTSRSVSG